MDYYLINQNVLEVYKKCDIHSFPIDCIKILKKYRYKVYTYQYLKSKNEELYLLCKKTSNDAFIDRSNRVIAYNSKVLPSRIRFSLMHELGHLVLKHTGDNQENEEEADYFASCVLAPRAAIKTEQCKNAEDIHNKFGLSYAASNRTWTNYLKSWNWTSIDDKLALWIYFPEYYKHLEQSEKPRKQRRSRKYYRERGEFIAKYNPDLIFIEHDLLKFN